MKILKLLVLGTALIIFAGVPAKAQWLSGITVSAPTSTSATVNWESCAPGSSSVSYGTTSAYGAIAGNATPAMAHSIPLTGLLPATTYHFAVSSADSTGAIVAGKDSTFTTAAAPPPPTGVTIWPATIPALVDANDAQAVELGVKFTSDVPGQIFAIRFYKAAANSGTHTGSVWSSTGTKLASVTFANETASGWQEQALTTPVSMAAGTIYVVSYHTTAGHYSDDQNYFATPFNSPPLHALIGGGVYVYGDSAFPNAAYKNSNYWIDLRFSASIIAPPVLHPNLRWTASPSTVTGYNVYRATVSGGPYTKVNSALIAGTSYVDNSAMSGTWFYVATAVNSSGTESIFSNEIMMVVP